LVGVLIFVIQDASIGLTIQSYLEMGTLVATALVLIAQYRAFGSCQETRFHRIARGKSPISLGTSGRGRSFSNFNEIIRFVLSENPVMIWRFNPIFDPKMELETEVRDSLIL